MLVPVLIGPLGDISFEIEHAKWACPFRKGIHVCGRTHGAASIYGRYGYGLPIVTPGIKARPSSDWAACCHSHSCGRRLPAHFAYARASSIETQVTGFLSHP